MRATAVLLIGLVLMGLSCAPAAEHPAGIEVLGIQLLADGGVARLNYRVVDYEVARRALRAEVRLYREGADRALAVLSTGRLGPLRQRPVKDGRPQFMIFVNGEGGLRKGDRAVMTVGETRIVGIQVS